MTVDYQWKVVSVKLHPAQIKKIKKMEESKHGD